MITADEARERYKTRMGNIESWDVWGEIESRVKFSCDRNSRACEMFLGVLKDTPTSAEAVAVIVAELARLGYTAAVKDDHNGMGKYILVKW